MAEEIVMPRLSDTMERGTIARWLVHEGDAVHEGDVLAEIETDKATMELNAYSDGVLLRILVQDGEAAELGAPIAVVGAEGEDASGFSAAPRCDASGDRRRRRGWSERSRRGADASGAASAADARRPQAAAPADEPAARTPAPDSARAEPAPGGGELKASPVARRMATDAGFDLRSLAGKGSGPDGRIVRVDVERALEGGAPAKAAERRGGRGARGRAGAGARRRSRRAEADDDHRSEPDAARGRAAHERVQVAGAALLPAVRDRHGQGAGAARGAQRRARRATASS